MSSRLNMEPDPEKPEIPNGWRELLPLEIIKTDDKIFAWNNGPWVYVGGTIIGERYGRKTMSTDRHWTIIRHSNP